jgi:hypothetical protein
MAVFASSFLLVQSEQDAGALDARGMQILQSMQTGTAYEYYVCGISRRKEYCHQSHERHVIASPQMR